MKITLTEWASRRYSPAPSAWTLRRLANKGKFYPPAEKFGRTYYVDENARLLSAAPVSLVERMRAEA